MKNNSYPLSTWRIFWLITWYFIGYEFVLPYIFSWIALSNDPTLTHFPLIYQVGIYLIALIIAFWLAFPLLKQEWHFQFRKLVVTIIYGVLIAVLFNVVFAIIMASLQGPQNSANQAGLELVMYESIPLYALMTGVLAPFLEEIIFRGVLYRGFKAHFNTWIALFISAFLFGFIHVSTSLFLGDFNDFIYLFLYGGIGLIFIVAYEYNDSIWACILLHAAYNLFALSMSLI